MSKQAPRTIETVARIQVLSDIIQNRIMRDGRIQMHITDSGYNVDPDYFPRMQRMLARAIKINRYGADLVSELGIKQ